jgi:ech hydrogenase subunit F
MHQLCGEIKMPLRKISKTILKSMFGEPATLMYPARARTYPQASRGRISIEIEKCIFCGLCRRKCPTAAIWVNKEKKTWEIDRLKCITCSACIEACPKKCLGMRNKYSPAQTSRQNEKFTAPEVKPGAQAEVKK